MRRLEGKVAVITGAAGGVGAGIAERLVREGVNVVIGDVNQEVETTAKLIMTNVEGSKCIGMQVDVSNSEQVENLVQRAVSEFGRLDIMVNNAGIVQTMASVAETPETLFDKIISVNLKGVFLGARAATKQMLKQGQGGCIINIGSYFGKTGEPYFACYSSSKAGVIVFTQAHALEVARQQIRVNCICPGNIATDMHWKALQDEAVMNDIPFEEVKQKYRETIPLQRHGTPDDIASAVVYLVSADGEWVTGQALNVNGGLEVH